MRLLFALKLDSHYPEALPYVDSIRIRMPLFFNIVRTIFSYLEFINRNFHHFFRK